ncbi:MAG: hypothetical protein PHT87_07405 [Bacteroidales bacterium]|nr:hypothetical protein [Bacteroidales bacterium]
MNGIRNNGNTIHIQTAKELQDTKSQIQKESNAQVFARLPLARMAMLMML